MANTKMIFDTNCVFCSGSVKFLLKHEYDRDVVFVNAWSQTGIDLAAKFGLTEVDLNNTFLVISYGQGFVKSDGVLELLKHQKAPWRWLRIFRFVPRPMRDIVYSLIARNRYKIFGYRENCLVPDEKTRLRFIDV